MWLGVCDGFVGDLVFVCLFVVGAGGVGCRRDFRRAN